MKKHLAIPLFKAILLLFVLVTYSCKTPEPRKPISRTTSSTTELSIENNKQIYAAEEAAIEKVIAGLDQKFERSTYGFYYSFTQKDSLKGKTPAFGDRVTFEYNVIALNGDTIYSKDELSPITKSMEQEYGIFRGMRDALKLMQTGEEATFYFPSYTGYGYYGDQNRIGTNVPFKSDVKLLGINIEE
ncbi:gliding motility-associated peptidyl-prolyl isomerase GldI [Nonlabens ulvanivorans]|uniref:Peptidyl-prolyl cis-trans isomerase n=1 Tax=Nonlabens ulvanivorans TaxID=906888 RepID=A0A081DG12_NONUL|nr:gliding motility-associated peptidyl-prolyl isomerase GldI [Nonlabens ulvanivorans]GAK77858.1 gliding motility protein gldI [Nonlabens ulvanivorans]